MSDTAPAPSNVYAVAGLVCAFFLAPLGVALSIVGLARARTLAAAGHTTTGHGLALAGLIVGIAGMLLSLALGITILALAPGFFRGVAQWYEDLVATGIGNG